jgi:hypothetical protein
LLESLVAAIIAQQPIEQQYDESKKNRYFLHTLKTVTIPGKDWKGFITFLGKGWVLLSTHALNLRDERTGKVRRPGPEEWIAIKEVFPQCNGYRIANPILVLQCSESPVQSPVTVAGLPTVFMVDMSKFEQRVGRLGNPLLADIGGEAFWVKENHFPSFKL